MSDSEVNRIKTVSDLVDYTYNLQKSTTNYTVNKVQLKFFDILHHQHGIPFAEMSLGSELVRDIGLD